jgi:4-amino-4-deoxy-L-arabinose transferase-like glycosyltransferase
MSPLVFTSGSPKHQTQVNPISLNQLWGIGLFLAALLLFCVALGNVPLRDWDEGIVAQVAREIARGEADWLYPTLHGVPYLNKPPLVHLFISWMYNLGGIEEWTARFPSAFLTAASVPILYWLGLELFYQRTPAIFSALVYLTLLPVVRHGRLAMLDGTVLFLMILMVGCVLRSRRDLRYALASGLAFGFLCLTKGLILGLLLGGIAIFFLVWDTPRLLKSRFFWLGISLGCIPVLYWYSAQWIDQGEAFITTNLFSQSLRRIWQPVESNQGNIFYYLFEILKYSLPWLIFWIPGLYFSWQNRHFSWGKLIIVWTGVYLLAISAMSTKLPWYVLPIYPAFALAVGAYITEVWREGNRETGRWSIQLHHHPDMISPLPDKLWPIFAVLAGVSWVACFYLNNLIPLIPVSGVDLPLKLTATALALTLTSSAFLMIQKDRQFIIILIWGLYVSLFLFCTSIHWVWELAEDYPVKPVAELIQTHTPVNAKVYTSHPTSRPSLNFYSDRKVQPRDFEELQQYWQGSKNAYLLLDRSTLNQLQIKPSEAIETVKGWTLVKPPLPSI